MCILVVIYINSTPPYGCCLVSKNKIHLQSKGMGRSSVFIIDVANHGKNVSDSAGVNESAFLNVFFAAPRPRLFRVKREVGCPALVRQLNYIPLRLIGRLSGI